MVVTSVINKHKSQTKTWWCSQSCPKPYLPRVPWITGNLQGKIQKSGNWRREFSILWVVELPMHQF